MNDRRPVVREYQNPILGDHLGGGIVGAPDGNLYFAGQDHIMRVSPEGTVTSFLDLYSQGPDNVILGPDGYLWFTLSVSSRIGRVRLDGTGLQTFDLDGGGPVGLAIGPDGNVWFTTRYNRTFGRIVLATGAVQQTEVPRPPSPAPQPALCPLIKAPDGRFWSAYCGAIDFFMRFDTQSYKLYRIPTENAQVSSLAVGPDGNIWFTESNARKVGWISADGVHIQEIETPQGQPTSIAAGPDGNLWVTLTRQYAGSLFNVELPGRLLRVTPSGDIAEFSIPSGNEAVRIAAGPDGRTMWFTERTTDPEARYGKVGSILVRP